MITEQRKSRNLATARIGTGAIERACATATEAVTLMRRVQSPRIQARLATQFRAAAEPFATSAAVREFDAKYRSLTATPQAT